MARGIKSFELLHSANRWYIVQMYWDSERPDNMIPKSRVQIVAANRDRNCGCSAKNSILSCGVSISANRESHGCSLVAFKLPTGL